MASPLLFLLQHHYARANGGQASAEDKEMEGTSSEAYAQPGLRSATNTCAFAH